MNRKIILFIFLCMSLVLAGCSIPMGDKVLEISFSGIEFVDNEEEEEVEEQDEDEEKGDETEKEKEDEASNEKEEDKTEPEVDDVDTDCEEQDYSAITDDLKEGFFIPDCAVITSVSKDEYQIAVYFSVEGGDWQETFHDYKEYFGETLSEESQSPTSGSARLKAYLDDESNNYTLIDFDQYEEELQIRLIQYFPEKD